jgi:hypothetical protein
MENTLARNSRQHTAATTTESAGTTTTEGAKRDNEQARTIAGDTVNTLLTTITAPESAMRGREWPPYARPELLAMQLPVMNRAVALFLTADTFLVSSGVFGRAFEGTNLRKFAGVAHA